MSNGSVNKVFLIGRIGVDAHLRYMPSGTAILQLKVATTEAHTGKDKYHSKETEWHSVDYFGEQAEYISEHCHKGDMVQIEGRLRTRKWTDKRTGLERYSTEIIGHEFNFIGEPRHHNEHHHDHGTLRDEFEKIKTTPKVEEEIKKPVEKVDVVEKKDIAKTKPPAHKYGKSTIPSIDEINSWDGEVDF